MRETSLHVEPLGVRATAQHYLKDMVYGANDGLVTTFAVVAGVEGGALTRRAVLIVPTRTRACFADATPQTKSATP